LTAEHASGQARKLIIAIDGVVGAGKSTTARRVADELGYRHLDTGAMYRAVTLAALRKEIVASDEQGLADLLAALKIELEPQNLGGRIWLDGEDVSSEIRTPEVSRGVGPYADLPLVRRALVSQQQAMGAGGGVVADGRDIGYVVFPDADLKVLLTADLATRAERRYRELNEKGVKTSLGEVEADIRRRDRADSERDYGAERDAETTRVLDTTSLTIEEQVARIVSWARESL
jgi:cytidylate kinase